jgi:hypothetical protein
MTVWKSFVFAAILLSCDSSRGDQPWTLSDMTAPDDRGNVVYHPRPIDGRFLNPRDEKEEQEFQARARRIIAAQSEQKVPAGNTYFENEKRTYGYLMAQALGPRGMAAIKDLQLEDAQAKEWHRDTAGIDFYACFTLKHQTRKYFYFGDLLGADYRQRMFDGAKALTERDPLRRPHYAFKQIGEGWGPDQRNSWVDVRSTENLFLMRVTSVYLFAEETGNRDTAAAYKKIILDYAKTLYRVGIGEWDSENYHGHSCAPLCNLYDFAQDDEVKLAAKACLDWFFAAGAVKYYRGGFNGPTKRDYNHVQPFGGSAASMLWVHFGDCPRDNEAWESDEVHLITSAYRPPPAVLALARKKFEKPVEIFASKPHYTATTTFDAASPPEHLETQYIGHSFQMGSLARGTTPGATDVNGFKILVSDERQGARALQAVCGPDPAFVGSPQYQQGKVAAENRVGQFRNLAVWLVKDGKSPWRWVVPESVRVSQARGVTFLQCDRTWVAVRSLGASPVVEDAALTQRINAGEKPRFPGHKVLSANGNADGFCGLAIEVGEPETHGDFAKFTQQVLAAEVDVGKLAEGVVQYKAADGKWLGVHWNDDPRQLGVWRNGQRHDWQRHAAHLYTSGSDDAPGPIESKWGSGELVIRVGGSTFTSRVDESGKASFTAR